MAEHYLHGTGLVMTVKDVGDLCTHCHRDTGWGSSLFVDRIPSTTESEEGYLCRECLEED